MSGPVVFDRGCRSTGRVRLTWQRWTLWLGIVALLLCAPLSVFGQSGGAQKTGDVVALPATAPPGEASTETRTGEAEFPPGLKSRVLHRNEVERAWFTSGPGLGRRASTVRRVALESGLHEAGGPARALIAPGGGGGDLAQALLAVELAPNLPLAHLALASARWDDGERAFALRSLLAALAVVPHDLEAALWLASSLLALFAGVLVLGSIVFIAIVGTSVFPRAAHDLGDLVSSRMPAFARAALLAGVVLAPLAFGEGLLGLALALLAVGVVYGGARHRTALALAAVLLVLGMFPVANSAGRVLAMLAADPVAESALAVRQGMAGDDEIALLRAAGTDDLLAGQALAAHARQIGDLDEALARYEALAEKQPREPVIATNLANLHFRRGAFDEAVALYQVASKSLDSPVLWFNLSQAHARSFRMEPFETALTRAQQLSVDTVAELSHRGDPNFVADLPLPLETIRSRMLAASQGAGFAAELRAPLAPGRIAADWIRLAGGLALSWIAALVLGSRFETAGSCSRCGVRVCARCDGTVRDSNTCDNCHRLFYQPDDTDPALRAIRLEQLRQRELRIDRVARFGSLVFPGVGGMVAGRPDLAFLAMLFFGWAAAALRWRSGIVPDPLVLGSMGPLILTTTALVAAVVYAVLVLSSLAIRRSQ